MFSSTREPQQAEFPSQVGTAEVERETQTPSVSPRLGGHIEEGANRIDGVRGHHGRAVLCLRHPQQWAATIYPKNLPRWSSIPTRQ